MEAIVSTNNTNNYSVSELNYLKESIENMSQFNQIEILKIFKKHNNVTLNENKSGIHINLTEVKDDILNELETYIKHVNAQENDLIQDEKKKEDYKNIYFDK